MPARRTVTVREATARPSGPAANTRSVPGPPARTFTVSPASPSFGVPAKRASTARRPARHAFLLEQQRRFYADAAVSTAREIFDGYRARPPELREAFAQ